MKCLRVFGRNVVPTGARRSKSNVSGARSQRHRSGGSSSAGRSTLQRGAHNQRRRRPRTTTGGGGLSRDQQVVAARTDRLWNFGVQSASSNMLLNPHDVPGNGLSYERRDGSLQRRPLVGHGGQTTTMPYNSWPYDHQQQQASWTTNHHHQTTQPLRAARSGFDFVGGSAFMTDDHHHRYLQQSWPQPQQRSVSVASTGQLKAYQKHHILVWIYESRALRATFCIDMLIRLD